MPAVIPPIIDGERREIPRRAPARSRRIDRSARTSGTLEGPVNPSSPRKSPWRPGAIVGGRYRLRAPIGAGAMGEVWQADHVSLGTMVAVKLVDAAHRDDAQELLARFQQEARAAAQL